MVATEVSGSFVLKDKNLLMVKEEETGKLNIPSDTGKRGELSADTAERVVEEHIGCECVEMRYKKRLKTVFELEGDTYRLQPYHVEIEGEPDNAEWVHIEKLDEKELATPIESIKKEIKERF